MALDDIVASKIIEISTVDPQGSIDEQLALFNIPRNAFIKAITIAEKSVNQKSRVIILYSASHDDNTVGHKFNPTI